MRIEDKALYHESDLESTVLWKMQKLLLELGKGFLFEQRQKSSVGKGLRGLNRKKHTNFHQVISSKKMQY